MLLALTWMTLESEDDYDNGELESLPGVRRFMLEHLINPNRVLLDIGRAGGTISGQKSEFCADGLRILGFTCDSRGLYPDAGKAAGI